MLVLTPLLILGPWILALLLCFIPHLPLPHPHLPGLLSSIEASPRLLLECYGLSLGMSIPSVVWTCRLSLILLGLKCREDISLENVEKIREVSPNSG
jgi:hypothetical protein